MEERREEEVGGHQHVPKQHLEQVLQHANISYFGRELDLSISTAFRVLKGKATALASFSSSWARRSDQLFGMRAISAGSPAACPDNESGVMMPRVEVLWTLPR